MSGLSAPRSEKVGRGKAASTVALEQAASDVLARSPYAMTLRQLYYALISAGSLPKVEAAYGRLKRVIRELREDGTVPWEWLVDHTRSVFQARTWDGLAGLLADSARLYRRDLMRSQPVAIQLWAESDSIGSVIARTADRYTIPTFIGRGYSARGYLWAAAQDAVQAREAGKQVHILHVGDHDPSGEDIFRDVSETLRLYAIAVETAAPAAVVRRHLQARMRDEFAAPDQDVHGDTAWQDQLERSTDWLGFQRLALPSDQIEEYGLPVRPPKTSDVRTARFKGSGSVEVEALPVDVLLAIVEEAILTRVDAGALAAAELAEESEREVAHRIAATPVDRLVEAAA